jgi:hypothetical protein
MKKMKLVMVGNGMAGVRTLEELLKIAPDLCEITVFGAEHHPNYNLHPHRALGTSALAVPLPGTRSTVAVAAHCCLRTSGVTNRVRRERVDQDFEGSGYRSVGRASLHGRERLMNVR